jgi:polyphosphate kinase
MSHPPDKFADKPQKHGFDKPSERYINREMSWLAFNTRVVEESTNALNPLLERVNFLSISAGNLDEFYMVRVAGLKDHVMHQVHKLSDDGQTPKEQLEKIHEAVRELMQKQQDSWNALRKELKDEGIVIARPDDLSASDVVWIKNYYEENLFPVLTPIAIDPAHPFPFLPNLGVAQLFSLQTAGKEQIAVIPLPLKLPRFIRLPSSGTKKKKNGDIRFVRLESILEVCFELIFPNAQKLDGALFRIVRDSDLDVEEEAEDLMRTFEQAVKERRRGQVIRATVIRPISNALRHFITEHMHIGEQEIVEVDGLIGIASLSELMDIPRPELKYPPHKVRFPERINDFGGDCFAAISAKDIVVHHPFESFDVVVQFLRQAARDPDVVSIKQTLYRTSKDSPIVKALMEAAEAGKSVTALVELKARFDEEANIKWARDMEHVGVQVVFGFFDLKTHAKVSLVTRRTEGKLKSYVHFGTGNYHPTTARIYTDLSFFTCDPVLCRDAAYMFNFLTGYAIPREMKKLVLAPRDLRKTLLQLIEEEIGYAKAGKPANIWAKMNALVDVEIIDALYAASSAGVQVDLIIRGICCLRPGVAGLSENIRVKSLVGRFLEHSRIYCFGGGNLLPSPEAKLFICSADWMPRNFDWRVEAMVPIENPTVHAQIMGQIMFANLKDEKNSWLLDPDGSYRRMPPNAEAFSAHEYFMNNPSLSGRGKAMKKTKAGSAMVYKLKKKE